MSKPRNSKAINLRSLIDEFLLESRDIYKTSIAWVNGRPIYLATPAASDSTQLTNEESAIIKQYSRRKTFLFGFFVSIIAFASVLGDPSETSTFLIDDYLKVILSIVAVVIIIVTWRRDLLNSLKRVNTIVLVIGVIFLIASLMGVALEIGGTSGAVADDFPGIIIGIFLIINGVL